MTTSHWRLRAREAIAAALTGMDRSDLAACTKAIDAAYPFGERAMWPYKQWLIERKETLANLAPGGAPKPCAACGAKPWASCRDIETGAEREPHESRGEA